MTGEELLARCERTWPDGDWDLAEKWWGDGDQRRVSSMRYGIWLQTVERDGKAIVAAKDGDGWTIGEGDTVSAALADAAESYRVYVAHYAERARVAAAAGV